MLAQVRELAVEDGIEATRCQERGVDASLGDVTVLYGQDQIDAANGAEAVCELSPRSERTQSLLNNRFGAYIYIARRFIENEDA